MDFKVTDTTTYQDLINAVHEANALGEGLTLLNGNGVESFTQDALEAMVSDENIMDSFLIDNYRHLLPDGHRLKTTEEDLKVIKEKLGWGDDEGSFDADYAELPQDIADRAVELEEELKSLLEKGDVKGFIERFDDAVTELSDMSNDDDTSFWRNTLERRMDSLLEKPIEQSRLEMQEGLYQKAPNWQNIAYLDPTTVDAEAARLAINDSFSTSASAPHEAPSVDRSFVHKVEEPAALA